MGLSAVWANGCHDILVVKLAVKFSKGLMTLKGGSLLWFGKAWEAWGYLLCSSSCLWLCWNLLFCGSHTSIAHDCWNVWWFCWLGLVTCWGYCMIWWTFFYLHMCCCCLAFCLLGIDCTGADLLVTTSVQPASTCLLQPVGDLNLHLSVVVELAKFGGWVCVGWTSCSTFDLTNT